MSMLLSWKASALSVLRKDSAEPVPEVCHDRAIVIVGAEVLYARGIPSKLANKRLLAMGEARLGTILIGNNMIEYDQLEAPSNAIFPP
jgi:hypothetical protein